ncbi:MAG: PKD domain-containing protein [Ferruginibacter sp.]
MKKSIIYLFAAGSLTLLTISCKKENAGSGLKAVFSYVADGYKVNFTNFSADATTYSWDFGDSSGQKSTNRSPEHVFTHKGDFLVSLTASNGTETNVFKDTVSIIGPNIRIDGDFTDWQYVPYTYQNAAAYSSTIRSIKSFASSDQIYFYLEGTSDMKMEIMDIYMDSDNNPATGYGTWYYPVASGADFLLEGSPTGGWGDVFAHIEPGTGWGWNGVSTFPDALNFSALKTVAGKNIIEFSIKRSSLGTTRNFVNVGIVESNSGWTEIGKIPEAQTPTSKFLAIQL